MKKIVFIILFVSILIKPYAQGDTTIVRIEFSSLTRGAHQNIVISKTLLEKTSKTHHDVEEKTVSASISTSQWEQLTQTLSNVSLNEIPALESPTRARAYDGARHSSITITTSSGKRFLHTFDNENPNEKLDALMKAISALAEL